MPHIAFTNPAAPHRALGVFLRLRLLRLLMERELCVCELMRVLNTRQYAISRHLGVLKSAGLLRSWREGIWVHYELSPAVPAPLKIAFKALCGLWDTHPAIRKDLALLRQSPRRGPGAPAAPRRQTDAGTSR